MERIQGTAFEYMAAAMTSRDVVVFYDIAKGLTFPGDVQRTSFIRLMGFNAPQGRADQPSDGRPGAGTSYVH